MARADLERLIQRATPRVEDHRSVDRTDFIRREFGHMTLREVVDSVDALEFSIDSFLEKMKEIAEADSTSESSAETGVHGLQHVVEGMRLFSTPTDIAPTATAAPTMEGADAEPIDDVEGSWEETAAQAKSSGGECFKRKDYAGAILNYGAAIRATPKGHENLSALYSNRSAALLGAGCASAALADAVRCVELAPSWPKSHFRNGCSLRELGRFGEAVSAFRAGQAVEPSNKDWEREVEKTERLHRALPNTLARQFVWYLLPDLLAAWVRSGAAGGVLQVQVKAELLELGTPKWQLLRDKQSPAKAQARYAFVEKKGYLANLAANIQSPPEGVAARDLEGRPLKIAEVSKFLETAAEDAVVHIDVQNGGAGPEKMAAIICCLPCDEQVRRYLAPQKDPAPPKGAVEGVLQIQRKSGFPKVLPRLLGFQALPGDLNFPVVDLERDAPGVQS